jgi:hypothetical protein
LFFIFFSSIIISYTTIFAYINLMSRDQMRKISPIDNLAFLSHAPN